MTLSELKVWKKRLLEDRLFKCCSVGYLPEEELYHNSKLVCCLSKPDGRLLRGLPDCLEDGERDDGGRGGREGGREGERGEGREGGRERGREGGREGEKDLIYLYEVLMCLCVVELYRSNTPCR